MKYFKTEVPEKDLLPEMVRQMVDTGWSVIDNFFQLSADPEVFSTTSNMVLDAYIARHVILENVDSVNSDRQYGISQLTHIRMLLGDLVSLSQKHTPEERESQLVGKILPKVLSGEIPSRPSLYTYMIESYYPIEGIEPKVYTSTHASDEQRMVDCLDIELMGTRWDTGVPNTSIEQYLIRYKRMNIYQSPIVEIDYRHPETQRMDFDPVSGALVTKGNAWPDTLLGISGNIDSQTASFVISPDKSSSRISGEALTSYAYIGKMQPDDDYNPVSKGLEVLDVVFGSSIPKTPFDSLEDYDFTKIHKSVDYATLQPLMRDYGDSAGNGITDIILRRSKDGARYLRCCISTLVAPNEMVPDRLDDTSGSSWVPVWNRSINSEYNYKFNPSDNSDEVTLGEAYVINPEQGDIGTLRNVLLSNPLSMLSGDIITVDGELCPPSMEVEYQYHLIEGISPFTTRPSVHYRPLGVCLKISD